MRPVSTPTWSARLRMFAAAAIAITLVAGCTSDDRSSQSSASPVTDTAEANTPSTDGSGSTDTVPTTSTDGRTPTDGSNGATCVAPKDTAPVDVADLGNNRDFDVTSFDGTTIRAHWFPLAGLPEGQTAPTVLMGPGWGSAGDTDISSVGALGATTIGVIRDAGYNVLTWDPRGFGESTGVVTIDSVDFEGRDVQQLIDWVATLPSVSLDSSRDPRLGMVGGSYGGGIQLVTAPVDCRIDALVPVIAWNSLSTSLYKNETPKTGWINLLVTVASFGSTLDPTIARAQQDGNETGTIEPADAQWLANRGPGNAVSGITVPTLLIQGTVDTLFTLDEAIANYDMIRDNGVPTAMVWFCGGHGICLTDKGDTTTVATSAVAWLDRYVKHDESVDTGPGFRFVDQGGVQYSADTFSEGSGGAVTASGSGTLALTVDGGAGPAVVDQSAGLLGAFISQITPGPATNSIDVTISTNPAIAADHVIVGSPDLTLTYTGTAGTGDRPQRVFAQFVDPSTGRVLGNQITPIDVVLDGAPHTVTVPLEAVAFTLHPGATLTLQLVASTVIYAQPQTGGSITFASIDVSLPISADVISG
ncbi:MAG: CocE/NonD family hydrolase [Ilumatobacteraceae bacterium]